MFTHTWSQGNLIANLISVSLEALPFLAFGYFIAGLLSVFIANKWVMKILGRESSALMSPIKGALFGTPIPLCSCSVIPVAIGLKKQGANKGSVTAFLVSAPETGADSLILSYVLLGPIMVIARLISALATAMITAWSVIAFTGNDMPADSKEVKSCCATNKQNLSSVANSDGNKPSIWQRFLFGQRHAFTTLLDDSFNYMIIALVLTALIKTYIPSDFLSQYSHGVWAMTLTVILSFPMYICASASTPIAAGLLLSGVSPGVALVFMLSGPASNIATVMVVKRLMSNTAALVYVLSISTVSVCAGLLLNDLVTRYQWDIIAQANAGSILPHEIAITLSLLVLICATKPLRPYIGLAENPILRQWKKDEK